MTTTTNVAQVKLNIMTQAQYTSAAKNANELYMVTDAKVPASDVSGLSTVATSGSYNDLTNKPTIPTVNNATLTITQGGTTKGTFTANASSDVTIALDAGGGGGSLPSQTGNAGKFLTTDGTDASWGVVKTHDLFDFKWSDHELNDQSWLNANTFSWQDGTVYSDAYSHLVADYSGGTSKTETIGSHTITFVEASDGHRITTDESTVADIYTESGVAWFYVLDTANQRFKLPRSTHGQIVEKYQSGTNWYRVYSDGWCEQGGYEEVSGSSGTKNVSLLETMSSTDYSIMTTDAQTGVGNGGSSIKSTTLAVDSFDFFWTSKALVGFYWEVKGYVSSYPSKGQYKHLYFYVGQFSQSATEQTAGLNAELFNGKVDLPSGVSQSSCDFVVESQLPNAGNNYTWYRLYKSGWVEQGGRINRGLTNNEVVTIALPVEYEDTNYTVTTSTFRISGTNSPTDNKAALISDMATDSFSVKNTRFEGYFSFMWEAKGKKASS